MADLQNSFLHQLMQKGQIENPVMSFYTSTTGQQSYVKFGSMDMNALEGSYS